MIYHNTKLQGLNLIEMEPNRDERGHFARIVDSDDFTAHGMDANFVQISCAYNDKARTLRGMHFQLPLAPMKGVSSAEMENKLLKVTNGRVFYVAIDLRMGSETFCQWFSTELSGRGNTLLYIPYGIASGYLTLEDDTQILYAMTAKFIPKLYRGVRWNDQAFGISWPFKDGLIMAERDRNYPDFEPAMAVRLVI